ncbi:amino acid ABC transporter permease [uncultured Ruthenibacterium sp.]|uniref:amino acid ABC transporter permease n=1 Tax=uncultured Ruthenibacterium sp. TaxID=1905347 RepID=UPI00349EE955
MERMVQLGNDIVKLWDQYWLSYLTGMRDTLLLALVATVIGCLIGLLCGILNTIPYEPEDSGVKRFVLKLIRAVVRVYVEVFRGTPMILQAVFVYYGLPYLTNSAMQFSSVWAASILVVSINTGAYMAESVRGGIISVDPGQTEGAKAIGMNHFQTMTSVILPQALRNIMPQIGNNFIINVKDTSVMFIISFTEFFAVHRGVVGATYMYFPSAAIEMVGYLVMTLTASALLRWMEKKMDGPENFDLTVADPLVPGEGMHRYKKNPKEPNTDYRIQERQANVNDVLNSDRPADRYTRKGGRSK